MPAKRRLACFSILCFLFIGSRSVYSQAWDWGKQSSLGGAEGYTVATDNRGNCCLLGSQKSDTLVFAGDSAIGGYSYIVTCNKNGNFLWTKTTNTLTAGYGAIISICYDSSGNLYAGGDFTDTLIFYPDTLISAGLTVTGFVVKYDKNGNVLWAKKTMNSSANCYVYSIAADNRNNLYVSLGGDSINSFANLSLPDTGEATIIKTDSNGRGIWARELDRGKVYTGSISTDGNSDIYMLFNNFFLIKYDSAGNLKWEKQTIDSTLGVASPMMTADKSGNIYFAGGYYNQRLIIGSDTLPFTTYKHVFYAKFNPDGNPIWLYGQKIVQEGDWYVSNIAVDTTNHFYLLVREQFSSKIISICFGKDTFKIPDGAASLIIKFDTSANVLCGTPFTEGTEDDGDGLAVDPAGQYIYVGGDLAGYSLIFGPDTLGGTGELPFIARWQPCENNTEPVVVEDACASYTVPNVFTPNGDGINDLFEIKIPDFTSYSITLFDRWGKVVYTSENPADYWDGKVTDGSMAPDGVYYYIIQSTCRDGHSFEKQGFVQLIR